MKRLLSLALALAFSHAVSAELKLEWLPSVDSIAKGTNIYCMEAGKPETLAKHDAGTEVFLDLTADTTVGVSYECWARSYADNPELSESEHSNHIIVNAYDGWTTVYIPSGPTRLQTRNTPTSVTTP